MREENVGNGEKMREGRSAWAAGVTLLQAYAAVKFVQSVLANPADPQQALLVSFGVVLWDS
jgi:hypothetical protein